MDISTLHQILWGVGIFFIGVLAGYMLKVVLVNPYLDCKNDYIFCASNMMILCYI
ncbi:MAG: hypothetical protein VZR53_17040 [Prevotella sp.]|nr:hypothetical protein [Prevotella sp.]